MIGFHAPADIPEKQEASGQPDTVALSTFLKVDSLSTRSAAVSFCFFKEINTKAGYLVKNKIQFTIPEAEGPPAKCYMWQRPLASSHAQTAPQHKHVVGRTCTQQD